MAENAMKLKVEIEGKGKDGKMERVERQAQETAMEPEIRPAQAQARRILVPR